MLWGEIAPKQADLTVSALDPRCAHAPFAPPGYASAFSWKQAHLTPIKILTNHVQSQNITFFCLFVCFSLVKYVYNTSIQMAHPGAPQDHIFKDVMQFLTSSRINVWVK